MDENLLKTPFRVEKEAKEMAIYEEYNQLIAQPGAMKTAVEEKLMLKHGIHSKSTIWQIRKRVERRLKVVEPDKENLV